VSYYKYISIYRETPLALDYLTAPMLHCFYYIMSFPKEFGPHNKAGSLLSLLWVIVCLFLAAKAFL